jgi:hypothetical protein
MLGLRASQGCAPAAARSIRELVAEEKKGDTLNEARMGIFLRRLDMTQFDP